MSLGETVRYEIRVVDAADDEIDAELGPVTWVSSDPSAVAIVSPVGRCRPRSRSPSDLCADLTGVSVGSSLVEVETTLKGSHLEVSRIIWVWEYSAASLDARPAPDFGIASSIAPMRVSRLRIR